MTDLLLVVLSTSGAVMSWLGYGLAVRMARAERDLAAMRDAARLTPPAPIKSKPYQVVGQFDSEKIVPGAALSEFPSEAAR